MARHVAARNVATQCDMLQRMARHVAARRFARCTHGVDSYVRSQRIDPANAWVTCVLYYNRYHVCDWDE
jgi:hypothetical protein